MIQIQPNGGMGNRMFQYMMARVIQERVPTARIVGNRLPEWDMPEDAAAEEPAGRIARLAGHVVPLERTIKLLGRRRIDGVAIRFPAMRLEYYEHRLRLFRGIFRMKRAKRIDFDNSLLMHVRLNKMSKYLRGGMQGVHRDYPAVPIAFFAELIARTGLKPVFVGEFGSDPISMAYRETFPDAAFIRHANAMDDYRLLYSATHAAISPSSFSWLATWISPFTQTVTVPLLGIFNPEQRPDVDLLPSGDARYSFFRFPVREWTASEADLGRVMGGEQEFSELTREAASALRAQHAPVAA